jgi:hypothetical protein
VVAAIGVSTRLREPGPTEIFPLILSSLFNGVSVTRRGDAGPKARSNGLDRAADSEMG